MEELQERIRTIAQELSPQITDFLARIVAAKSLSGKEDQVIQVIREEMTKVGFDEVKEDAFGNLYGFIYGEGPTIAYDAHIDVVDEGDRDAWDTPPFEPVIKDGWLYGRGASDQKAGMASIVYAGAIIKRLGVRPPFNVVATATVQEEDCDGLCWQYIVKKEGFRPDAVVITEPTNLGVYRGHRGRMEVMVQVKGVSAHGAMPQRGKNAIYMMADIVKELQELSERLKDHPFLGKGTLTVSQFSSGAPSQCSVADFAQVYIDRRLTLGETKDTVIEELKSLPSVKNYGAEVIIPSYARPTRTGYVMEVEKYYPTWLLEEDHPLLKAAVKAAETVMKREVVPSRWLFSTNGVATAGMFGIPTVGFGPGNEIYAHSPNEKMELSQLPTASAVYVLLGYEFSKSRK